MPLGFDREPNRWNAGDSADLTVRLYDEDGQLVLADQVTSVSFTVQKPDLSTVTLSGQVETDGSATLTYTDTDLYGEYRAIAQFSLTDGKIKSVKTDFEIIDPFNPPIPDGIEIIERAVWQKMEDMFDAEQEGPWLRDMTLNHFDRDKMSDFISEGLFDINYQNPPTTLIMADFTTALPDGTYASLPLLAAGVWLAVMRHLIRSYNEQPKPQGANVVYEDRSHYSQVWQQYYQLELATYTRWLALYKRQFLGLGHSKVLVGSKAGRLVNAPMRTRWVGRGYS